MSIPPSDRPLIPPPRRRRWPWIVAIAATLLAGWVIYAGRPQPGIAREAAEYEAAVLADPKTRPDELALGDAVQALLAVTAAPDLVLEAQARWSEGRALDHDLGHEPASGAAGRAAVLRRQVGFWQEADARRPDTAELAQHCAYRVPYATCTVTDSAVVPGSGGALRYQVAGLFVAAQDDQDTKFDRDMGAALADPMVGTTLGIFAADPGGWRMVLAVPVSRDGRPQQVASPAGPLLSITGYESYAPLLYAQLDGRWRKLYGARWMQAVAERAPAGTCLAGGFYVGSWPWPPHLLLELSRITLEPAQPDGRGGV